MLLVERLLLLPTLLDGRLPPNEREGVALLLLDGRLLPPSERGVGLPLVEGRLLPTLLDGRLMLPEERSTSVLRPMLPAERLPPKRPLLF